MIPLLVVKNLNKDFESSGESFEVFKSLNFEIYPKTSTALLGESGSGKTTLIHLIAGLESPDTGLIKIVFNQEMLVPSDLDEVDYSTIFKFKAISSIDGSSMVDKTTQ